MKKNVIVYSGFCGVNKRADEILTHTIFDYAHEVPDCISSESVSFDDNTRYFFIGTKKDNTYINDNFDTELSHDEEYAIKVCDGNVYICGSDENGVLYGLYFQSFTELQRDSIDGVLIADAVTDFVNKTSALFMEKYPELELQFGLHASSVKEKLQYIKNVNKDVRIVWEDAGSAPYSYIVDDMDDFDKTAELTKKIALLRGNDDKFGVVLKGFTKLDWSSFKHMTNSQCIGTASEVMQRERVMEKSKIWKYVQANWIVHAPKVYEMIQLMSNLKGGELDITALVEDGMFEKKIYYPVAVYAEMLWNTDADIKEIMSNTAMRSYVDFE